MLSWDAVTTIVNFGQDCSVLVDEPVRMIIQRFAILSVLSCAGQTAIYVSYSPSAHCRQTHTQRTPIRCCHVFELKGLSVVDGKYDIYLVRSDVV